MFKIRTYTVELILVVSATVITGTSIYLHLQNRNTAPLQPRKDDETLSQKNDNIYIDVAGAVMKPDLYEATSGSRLKDIIDLAGGLSEEADKLYIARNFNMSKFVTDQEKIYIPYTWDIINGTFTDESNSSTTSETVQTGRTISLNDASLEELDTLPGIGPVTAQKIIDNRPYSATDELLSKKLVKTNVFEEIKSLISL